MNLGNLDLILVVLALLGLQVWWIGMTIRNGQNEKPLRSSKDSLKEQKQQLENLYRKE